MVVEVKEDVAFDAVAEVGVIPVTTNDNVGRGVETAGDSRQGCSKGGKVRLVVGVDVHRDEHDGPKLDCQELEGLTDVFVQWLEDGSVAACS